MSMIWNYLVDHIPVWAYVVLICVGGGVLFYFFSPIIIPIWNRMPNWLKWSVGFVIAMFLAIAGGRYKGREDAELEQKKANEEAIKNRTKVDDEVAKMDRPTVNQHLDPWMRD